MTDTVPENGPAPTSRLQQKLDAMIDYVEKSKGLKVSKIDLCHDLYHMNKLIFDLYNVCKSPAPHKEKIHMIMSFRDPSGNLFLTRQMARTILRKYSTPVQYVYGELFKLKKSMHEEHQQAYQKQHGGGSPIAGIIGRAKTGISGIPKLLDDITVFIDQLLSRQSTFQSKEVLPDLRVILNWIFFPLWSLENTPFIGKFIEMPLDLVGIILDNVDIVLGALGPTIFETLGIVINAVQSIPVVGSVVGGVWLQIAHLKRPLEILTTNGLDILDMFVSITRKNYSMAYFSALNGIPNFADIIDALVNVLHVLNKYLGRLNAYGDRANQIAQKISAVFTLISSNIPNFIPIFGVLLQDPAIMIHPMRFIRRIILPNKDVIPVLKNFTTKQLEEYLNLLEPKMDIFKQNPFLYMSDINRLYTDIIEPWASQIPQFSDYGRNEILGYLYYFLNMSLNFVNPTVTAARRSLEAFTMSIPKVPSKSMKMLPPIPFS